MELFFTIDEQRVVSEPMTQASVSTAHLKLGPTGRRVDFRSLLTTPLVPLRHSTVIRAGTAAMLAEAV